MNLFQEQRSMLDTITEYHKEVFLSEANIYNFTSERSNGMLIQAEIDFQERILDKTKELDQSNIAMIRSANIYNFYAHYSLVNLEDRELFFKNFAISSKYAYEAIHTSFIVSNCFEEFETLNNEYLFQYLAELILSDFDDEAKRAVEFILQALESEDSFISPNSKINPILWFVLELYCDVNDIELATAKEFEYFTHPYDKVLQTYKTENLQELDAYVFLLCESRLALIEADNMFNHISNKIFPYEVLVLLQIRKKLNLKNPLEFSHPLMNQEICKIFYQEDINLELPSIEYIDEIVDALQKNCKCLNSNKEPTQKTLPNVVAPKTGKYRATLPQGHPQTQELQDNPLSYARFVKDEEFSFEGLEEYDTSVITWEFLTK
jgi:hypothetical protein